MTDHSASQLREAFLRQQAESWDDHVDQLRITFREHMADVKFVIENWDVLDLLTGFGLVSGPNKGEVEAAVALHTYELPSTLIEAMWWVVHFVSHEIHDDGSPAIVWVKRDPSLLPPEEPSTRMIPKVRELIRKTRAPWNWSSAHDRDAQAVLVHDNGNLLWPHANWIGSTAPGQSLAEAVRLTVECQARIDKAWESFKGEKRVRRESPIQRDLKIILDDLFKKEFMP